MCRILLLASNCFQGVKPKKPRLQMFSDQNLFEKNGKLIVCSIIFIHTQTKVFQLGLNKRSKPTLPKSVLTEQPFLPL